MAKGLVSFGLRLGRRKAGVDDVCRKMTGPTHQVHHRAAPGAELWQRKYSVTVQMRTVLFPRNRAGEQNTTPNPPSLFYALAESLRESWAASALRLPTLGEVLAAAPRHSAQSVSAPAPAGAASSGG